MHWESSGVVGFDLGPLLEGEMRTKEDESAYNSLIIGPRGFGALSLRWIQFASVLRCARSSYYYYVFILSAISPYTTGLKALFNQSNCTCTALTDK